MTRAAVHVARILMILCWPLVTYASTVTLGQGFGELGWLDVATVVVLSLFSGAVAMLQRMEREAAPAVPWRWISAHMSVALLAGVMAFFIGEAADLGNWQESLSIAVAAWGGSRVVESIDNRVFHTHKP